MIADNPARPFLSTRVWNRTTLIAMVHRPCVNKLHFSLCPEMVASLALMDVQDRTQYYLQVIYFRILQAMHPLPMHPFPLRFLLENAGECACALQHVLLPLRAVDYAILFAS